MKKDVLENMINTAFEFILSESALRKTVCQLVSIIIALEIHIQS